MNPKTRKEAESQRYGQWAGCRGNPFDPKHCACHTMTGGRASLPSQCGRKPGHGPDSLYCKKHADEYFPIKSGSVWCTDKHSLRTAKMEYATKTERTVTLFGDRGRTVAIDSSYEHYSFSKEEAKAYVRNIAESRIRAARIEIQEMEAVIKANPAVENA